MESVYVGLTDKQLKAVEYLAEHPHKSNVSYIIRVAVQEFLESRAKNLPMDIAPFFGYHEDNSLHMKSMDVIEAGPAAAEKQPA